jgi:adenylyltransferase/sulfurtransferase
MLTQALLPSGCMTADESERYSRQIRFRGIGEAGQERLLRARVAIVGCGALGTFQAGALARAGVGHLTLIDRDYVEVSNLQRQWLYEESDADEALPKAVAAASRLRNIASACHVTALVSDLTPDNIEDLLQDTDLILDGTDNFETRYLINDFAIQRAIPWIYGAAVGSYGVTMPVVPGVTACLACLYPAPPSGVQPTCETAGVLGPVTSAVASLQSATALMILAGETAKPVITTLDVWDGPVRQIAQPPPDPDCRACGRREFIWLQGFRRAPISLCGRNAVQIHERSRPVDLQSLRRHLEVAGEVKANEFALRFFPEPYEMTIFPDGRAIIKGTQDPGIARSLYARYVGS